MQLIKITIETEDCEVVNAIYGNRNPEPGCTVELNNDITLIHDVIITRRGIIDSSIIIDITVKLAEEVVTGVLINMIYDLLKGKNFQLKIGGEIINISWS